MSWTSMTLKHTCSWHDKLIVLWILNRKAKISLCILVVIIRCVITSYDVLLSHCAVIQFTFVQFSLSCYEFCILSKTECKSIYYQYRRDHECSSFRKLARNKWICLEICDFFFVMNSKKCISALLATVNTNVFFSMMIFAIF